ncbi:uncharacterized protein [Antedon mediterranea]|uniref:uncharacterized protein n=1 Tax=Antedon mediterranea TaxID=105859 RepID=UPI003AF7524B
MHSMGWQHQPVNGTFTHGTTESHTQGNFNIGVGPADFYCRTASYADPTSYTGDVYENFWESIRQHYPTNSGLYSINEHVSTNEASTSTLGNQQHCAVDSNYSRPYNGCGKSRPVIRDPPPVSRNIPRLPFSSASKDYSPVVLPTIANTDVHPPVSVRPISHVNLAPAQYQPPITIPTYPQPNVFTMPSVVPAPTFAGPRQFVPVGLPTTSLFKPQPPVENIQIYRPQHQRVVPRSYHSTSVRDLLKAKARFSNSYRFSPLRCTKRVKSIRARAAQAANSELSKSNSEKRRVANARERERVSNLNSGFENLRKHLPGIERSKSRRCSKVDTLRFAIDYIHQLEQTLWEDDMNQNRSTGINRDVNIWHVVPVNPVEDQVAGYKAYQVIQDLRMNCER